MWRELYDVRERVRVNEQAIKTLYESTRNLAKTGNRILYVLVGLFGGLVVDLVVRLTRLGG